MFGGGRNGGRARGKCWSIGDAGGIPRPSGSGNLENMGGMPCGINPGPGGINGPVGMRPGAGGNGGKYGNVGGKVRSFGRQDVSSASGVLGLPSTSSGISCTTLLWENITHY